MKVVLLGLNHRTAPVEVRERLAVAEPGPLLAKLVATEEIEEAVLISTCNRVEVVALTRRPEAVLSGKRPLLSPTCRPTTAPRPPEHHLRRVETHTLLPSPLPSDPSRSQELG